MRRLRDAAHWLMTWADHIVLLIVLVGAVMALAFGVYQMARAITEDPAAACLVCRPVEGDPTALRCDFTLRIP